MLNSEFKFFYGIVGEYAEEPDADEWWQETEVENALIRAGEELRRQREELSWRITNNQTQ
jgi:hypothetical protein